MGCGAGRAERKVAISEAAMAMIAIEEARIQSMQEALDGVWKYEVAPDDWQPFSQDTSFDLYNAYYGGQPLWTYAHEGRQYEVDFSTCLQTDLSTGTQQRIAWEVSAGTDGADNFLLGGVWKYEESSDVWCPFDADVSAELTVAYYCGEDRVGYETQDGQFDVDFTVCVHTNRATGEQRRIAWFGGDDVDGDADELYPNVDDDYEYYEQHLRTAFESGEPLVRYSAQGCKYEIDFTRMVQTNVTTGDMWPLDGYENEWLGNDEDTPETKAAATEEHRDAHATAGNDDARGTDDGGDATAEGTRAETRASDQEVDGMRWHGGHQKYMPVEPKKSKKKWSLAPGQRAQPRVGPAPKAQPQPQAQHGSATGGSKPQSKPPPHTAPRQKPPAVDAALKLPAGMEWPVLPRAKRVAETLFYDMQKSSKESLDTRKRAFRAACLTWHPDKNPKHLEVSTEVFKFLQTLKSWYFAD